MVMKLPGYAVWSVSMLVDCHKVVIYWLGKVIMKNQMGGMSSGDATAQTNQGLHYPLKESLDTAKCMIWKQRPGWYLAHAQDDLNLHIRQFRRHFFAWCRPNVFYLDNRLLNHHRLWTWQIRRHQSYQTLATHLLQYHHRHGYHQCHQPKIIKKYIKHIVHETANEI